MEYQKGEEEEAELHISTRKNCLQSPMLKKVTSWATISSTVPTKLLGTPPLFSVHSYGTTCPRKNAITLEPLGLDFFPFFPE